MIRRCAPAIFHYFTLLSFSSATQRQFAGEPNGSSPLRLSPPVLVAEYPKLPFPIPARSVRTDAVGIDRLFVHHGSPDQLISLLYCLDPRLDNTHPQLTIYNHAHLSSLVPIFYDPVVLGTVRKS